MSAPSPSSLEVAQGALNRVEPHVQEVPISVLSEPFQPVAIENEGGTFNGVEYPRSVFRAGGLPGVALSRDRAGAFFGAMEDLASIPRDDLVALTRQAVEARNTDDMEELPESHRRSRMLAANLLMYMLSDEEQAQVLGTAA